MHTSDPELSVRSLTGLTSSCKTYPWHAQASGGALALVDAVVEASSNRSTGGEVPAGYSIARPPGHHATVSQAMGFCLLNNVAIAARYAQQHHGLKKVDACFLPLPAGVHWPGLGLGDHIPIK